MPSAKQLAGKHAEEAVSTFLQKKGYQLLESNWNCKFGEADLIMTDVDEVVFVEVKYRRHLDYGRPEEMYSQRQQRRLKQTAASYMLSYPKQSFWRFDLVGVSGPATEYDILHLEDVLRDF